eukprot:c16976_g1_i2.p1 GENE.c16976_g1_i2~~c16976_g1_i2.p1  ORF type:complete len:525 (+),score=145.29 c16976_g1_i2:3-1577(+)
MGILDFSCTGAEMGKVVTRFPPEPSGYLHIGHVKASILNHTFARKYNGKLILRFDDTNPAKEKAEYEEAIVEDLARMGITPDRLTRTSDHFELIKTHARKLLEEGKAYMDKTNQDEMRKQRMDGVESEYRNQPVEENLRLWDEMWAGTEEGKTACMRAKMDMQATNKALRDPVCFRYSGLPHLHTRDKYPCYPTYDFACPIVDVEDGVTHALRDRQFQDRNAQYQWFLDAMNLRKIYVWGFSRLNLVRCLLSKRKIQWFVDQGLVEGWDDPRVPSIRGILRRGMTVPALQKFIRSQGASTNLNLMEWDSLWTFNKRVLDPIVPRYTALLKENLCHVTVTNYSKYHSEQFEFVTKSAHPKHDNSGKRVIVLAKDLWLEQADAASLEVKQKITLMNWGNATVEDITKTAAGLVTHVKVAVDPEDKDFKDTLKLTWLAQHPDNQVELSLVTVDHLITKDKLEDEDDVADYVTTPSKVAVAAIGDISLRTAERGSSLQLERKGFYIVDRALTDSRPMELIFIPDGKTK